LGLVPITNKKAILGISLAAVFAISLLGSAYASGHLTIEKASVDATPTEIKKAKIETTGKIPTKGGFVGYGVVTSSFVMPFPASGPADVVVATTHAGVLPIGEITGTHFGLAPNLENSFSTGTYGGTVASFTLSGSPTPNTTYGLTVCVDKLTPFLP